MSAGSVLVVAPSRKTRGGITAVVRLHEQHSFWTAWNCIWIETHIDRGWALKLLYFIRAWIIFLGKLPGCSIIHIHFSEPVSAFRKSFFLLPAMWCSKKIVLHFHSFSPETTTRGSLRWMYRWMFRQADLILVLSERWQQEVRLITPEQIPVSVLFNPAVPVGDEEERKPIVLFAGTLNARKGYADLIRAFSIVATRHPEWRLILAGNGETSEAQQLADSLGVYSRLELPGWVEGESKRALFNSASIFCLPSYAEGFPMAVVDAMAQGIPVLCTPVGGITDVFQDGQELFLFEAGNIDGLAGKLDVLMSNAAMRERIRNAATVVVTDRFHIEMIGEQLNGFYSSLVKKDQMSFNYESV